MRNAEFSLSLAVLVGEAVIPTDVDLQDPPASVPDMVRLRREGVDVVYATRVRREGDSSTKELTVAESYRVTHRISPLPISENGADFRMPDRRAVNVMKQLRKRNCFMKEIFTRIGFRQARLPFVRVARHRGNSKFGLCQLWNFAPEGMTSFRVVPLRLAMYLGLWISSARSQCGLSLRPWCMAATGQATPRS